MKPVKKAFMPRDIYNNGNNKSVEKSTDSEKSRLKRKEMREQVTDRKKEAERGKELVQKLKSDANSRGDHNINNLVRLANSVKNYLWKYRNYFPQGPLTPAKYDEMARPYDEARDLWEHQGIHPFANIGGVAGPMWINLSPEDIANMKLDVIEATGQFFEKACLILDEVHKRVNPEVPKKVAPLEALNGHSASREDIYNMHNRINDLGTIVMSYRNLFQKNDTTRMTLIFKETTHTTKACYESQILTGWNDEYRTLAERYDELVQIIQKANLGHLIIESGTAT